MDKIVLNTRERPLSTDTLDMQALLSRALGDVLRWLHARPFQDNAIYDTAFTPVTYGLGVRIPSANATSVLLQPGLLLQDSTTLAPVPSTYESSLRLGVLRTELSVTLPTPGSNTWYLLEAQVSETATSSFRDVLNQTTGKFEGTNVPKRKIYSVTTQWVAGSSTLIPVPSGGDWVPIHACLVQAGGFVGFTPGTHWDVRPQAAHIPFGEVQKQDVRPVRVPLLQTEGKPGLSASSGILIAAEGVSNSANIGDKQGGLRMFVSNISGGTPLDVSSATYRSPATTLAANTWYYLYLAPWALRAPAGLYTDEHRGVFVLSHITPDLSGFWNSADIELPAPFSNFVGESYCCPCIGALLRNAANTGWAPMSGGNGRYVIAPGNQVTIGATASPIVTAVPTTMKPKNATILDLKYTASFSAGTVDIDVGVEPSGGSAWMQDTEYLPSTGGTAAFQLRAPQESADSLRASYLGGTHVAGTARLIGFETRG
jgi:hypothetical protein